MATSKLPTESTALLPHTHLPSSFLTPIRPHAPLKAFILAHAHAPPGLLVSAALNENDLSPAPIALDLPSDIHLPTFRSTTLAILDIFRALILCLQMIETALRFLGPPSSLPDAWWHQQITLPLPSASYALRLATLICPPALHFLLGCAAVMAIHTRQSLGWSIIEIMGRSVRCGVALLALNQLLMCQTVFKTHGQVLLVTLPIWSLGWNLFFITGILTAFFLVERAVLKCLLNKLPCSLNSLHQSARLKAAAGQLVLLFDIFLVSAACAIPLAISYMLPGDGSAPDQDWWINFARTRSKWFWFFVSPTLKMTTHPRFHMVSTFAPIGWLPFVMVGAFYGRVIIRKQRTRTVLFLCNLTFGIYAFIVFGFTRVADIGNLTQLTPLRRRAFDWLRRSWQEALYTTTYPPDLAHLALNSALIFLALALLCPLPQTLLTFNPLIQFGRAPIFFYSIQLLSFHYLLPTVLGFLDWPSQLSLVWTWIVALSCLPVFWLACEAWVVWKDCQGPQSLWRFF